MLVMLAKMLASQLGDSGTDSLYSASAPAFAGMVSLLNEARLKAGKPTMGFLNPFLYANPDAFTDVVKVRLRPHLPAERLRPQPAAGKGVLARKLRVDLEHRRVEEQLQQPRLHPPLARVAEAVERERRI